MCSSLPAPPLATTGTPTDSLTRRVMARSKPAFVPSASIEFKTISPAPSPTALRAQSTASRPVDFRPPCEKDFPFIGRDPLGVNGNDDALASEFFRSRANQIRSGERRGIDADLVRAGAQHREHVLHGFNAAAHRQGHETFIGGPFDDIHHGLAPVRAGGDIEKNHFVSALLIVAHRQFNRVAHVSQFASLRLAKLDTPRDLAVMDVQARNNSFCNHHDIENAMPAKAKENDAPRPNGTVTLNAKRNLSFYLTEPVKLSKTAQKSHFAMSGIRIANNSKPNKRYEH